MKCKILITGGLGMLGMDVVPILKNNHKVVVTDKEKLDVTDPQAVYNVVESCNFDWVIHMAALTDLDWCEDNVAEVVRVNTLGTKNIAKVCAKIGCRLIYISTSGVFSGNKEVPYTEGDLPAPINVYGLSKYLGEIAVSSLIDEGKWLILRVGWLFGGGERDKKFVGKILQKIKKGPEVFCVNDFQGSPNYSVDMGHLINTMIGKDLYGLFHVANSGEPASRYDMAVAIRDFLHSNTVIKHVSSDKFPTKALRPKMEAIVSLKIDEYGIKLRNWRDALGEYVKRLAEN